jgi:hypothetical protein
MMQMLTGYCAVLAIAVLYYAWRDTYASKSRPQNAVKDRVAYMLWVAANRAA